jgi:hypothetical protein
MYLHDRHLIGIATQRRQARLESSIDEHTSLVQRVAELELETSDMQVLQQKAERLDKQLQGKKVCHRLNVTTSAQTKSNTINIVATGVCNTLATIMLLYRLQDLQARISKAEAELSQLPKLELKVAHLQGRRKLQSRLKVAVQMLKAETARVRTWGLP